VIGSWRSIPSITGMDGWWIHSNRSVHTSLASGIHLWKIIVMGNLAGILTGEGSGEISTGGSEFVEGTGIRNWYSVNS
jgi:hypothetical protein